MTLTREETARTIEVDGLQISYNHAGEGPAVVAIHGGGPGASGWANYARNIDALAEHSSVYLVDLPGFGRSGNTTLEFPVLRFYSSWVRRFMEEMGIEKATLVGNSLGGGTSMKLAIDAPHMVNGLILMGPAGSHQLFTRNPARLYLSYYDAPTRANLMPWLTNMVFDPASLTEELIAERFEVSLRPEIVANPPLQPWVALAGKELRHELSQVVAPTLIIWGRDDHAIGLDAAVHLVNELPNADLHIFSKCGHWAQWERADDFNVLAQQFLTKLRASSAS